MTHEGITNQWLCAQIQLGNGIHQPGGDVDGRVNRQVTFVVGRVLAPNLIELSHIKIIELSNKQASNMNTRDEHTLTLTLRETALSSDLTRSIDHARI